MGKSGAVILVSFLFVCCVVPSLATVHTVGDSAGWALSGNYATWAKGKTFKVGDSLVFKYPSGHTVDEVSSSDYESCTSGNSISSDSSGSTTIPLKTAGPHYFICGVTGHCSGGMKLSVTVAAAAGGGGGGGSTTAPSSGSGTATTSHPSSSLTLSPFIPLLVSGVVAIFSYFVI
ncbi:blue copper protein-like [Lycium barbarum]|uniref:blue copper protein-like n=1 Tax=Lycium barbarum TaxID=112863 RepID=UPI00293E2353|nr:blue copper protein-like [Lycium barbarum]